MNAAVQHLPILQVMLPLLGAVIVAFLQNARAAFALTAAISWTMPFIAGALLWQVMESGPISYHLGGWAPPWGIEYRVDLLNGFVLLLISAVGAVIMPAARPAIDFEIDAQRQPRFYCMFLLCLAGLLGVTATGDAFNAFVFLEISSLSTYVLIALGPDRRALLASYRYLIVGTIGATFYVIGVGLLYLATGTLNMADLTVRIGMAWGEHSRAVITALGFITVGIGLKLALFPLHAWLPNAYTYAPSWVTVFLSASATKVAVYLLVRFYFSVFGPAIDLDLQPVASFIVALSVAAMFLASISAVFEANLKRMLAYSSVAQIGYITLGIGLGNQAGMTGGLVHIVNHGIMKAALFLAATAVVLRVRTMRITELAGIGRKMPWTIAAFSIAGFGLIGTPGTTGFISKWYLVLGAIERGWWALAFLIVASSLISLVYVGRFLELAWRREPLAEVANAADPPASILFPLLVLAAATIYFGIDPSLTAGVAGKAAEALLGMAR
ncbi:MAG TPA: monovalent cation/H+ antiporter subunit D family protein [Alphaproteobacteria bacterium]|nr:monovalent cation/H+ antiporter subunit D family protein [Alphaproteobacteria bacterium]